jgi:hypothetical protein
MPRPPLDPLTNIGHCPPGLPATSPSRRQSSISYLPPDSPRLWSPRTQLVSTSLERSSSLSGANSPKEGHSRTRSIPQRAISEPAVLTLAERCVSRSHYTMRVHSCIIHLFTIGMRISCNLLPRRSPSASSYALSSRYTSRSSSNSSASGNASCVASLGEMSPQRRPLLLLHRQQCSMAWLEACARWQLPQQVPRSHHLYLGRAHHHRLSRTASQVRRRRIPYLRRQRPLRSLARRAVHASHSHPCHLWPRLRPIQAKWKANARRSLLGSREG